MYLPDPGGSELLEAGDLGVDVRGVDVNVHATRAVVETLDEEPDVVPGDVTPVILGVPTASSKRPAGRSRPNPTSLS